MGIHGYHKYCKMEVPNSTKTVNILEALEEHRRKTGEAATLIINMKTLWNFDRQSLDDVFGVRFNIIQRKIEEFLGNLKKANVKMIFPFSKRFMDRKGYTKEWAVKENTSYMEAIEAFDKIDQFGNTDDLERHYSNLKSSNEFIFWFPRVPSIPQILLDIAKKYGELVGPPSEEKLSYALMDQAMLASERNAYAVLGFESFYLIHQGRWKYWSSNDLDLESMTVSEYNKDEILRHLGLQYHHMPLFVVLTGCDALDAKYVKKLRYYFGPKKFFFKNVAHRISRMRYPLTNGTLDEISRELFSFRDGQNFCMIMKKILDDCKVKIVHTKDDPIISIVKNDFNNFAFEILMDLSIYLPPIFTDLRKKDMKPLHELVLPVLKKTSGILLKHKEDPDITIKLFLKRSHENSVDFEMVRPVFPETDIPDIKNILSGKISDEKKFELLLFITGLDLEEDQLKLIPPNYFFIILTMVYLNTHNSIKKGEAMGVLKTLIRERNQPISEDIEYPEKVSSRALRVSSMFIKVFKIFECCFIPIGFSKYNFELPFDGVYFQKRHFNESENLKYEQNNENLFDLLLQETLRPYQADNE